MVEINLLAEVLSKGVRKIHHETAQQSACAPKEHYRWKTAIKMSPNKRWSHRHAFLYTFGQMSHTSREGKIRTIIKYCLF
jgi:hypothetical protein